MPSTEARENCRIGIDTEQKIPRRRQLELLIGAAATALAGAGLVRLVSGEWGTASLAAAAFGPACLAAGASLARPRGSDAPAVPAPHAGDSALEQEDVLRSVTHDLRSPLGAIVNFATVLELDVGEKLDPEARGLLVRIRRAAHSALELLDGLARLTRSARDPLHKVPVDADALAREAFVDLPAAQRGGELTLGPLPGAVADPALLRACFAELLANAAKFSRGSEKPRVTVGGRRESDGSVVYWVADEGVGFDPRFSSRLFRAFERLHSRDEFPGAGVGLAIVRQVAERHGGRVWAEGVPGCGARFYFSLAAAEAAP
jgi:signal transduction histidine kinase